MARAIGSWRFFIGQAVVMAGWIAVNNLADQAIDRFPHQLLNLGLSMQAAMIGSILLIASNRADAKRAELAERTEAIAEQTYADAELLKAALNELTALLRENTDLTEQVDRLTTEVHRHLLMEEKHGYDPGGVYRSASAQGDGADVVPQES